MSRLLLTLIALGVASPAAAQSLTFEVYDPDEDGEPNWLIDIDDVATWSRTGPGAPTVVWDGSQYVMLFESRLTEAYISSLNAEGDYEGCRNRPDRDRVVWGLGRATSPDGFNWTVDPEPVLIPQEGTYYHCQVAQPTVVLDPETDEWHLYFKAQQRWERHLALDGSDPFGPSRFTGVGYAVSTDGETFTVPDAQPVLPIQQDFGYPSIVRTELEEWGEPRWFMYIAIRPELILATSQDPDMGWDFYTGEDVDPVAVLSPGRARWADDLVFNPSAVCEPPDETFPFTAFVGGQDVLSSGSIVAAGLGRATSVDGLELFLSTDSPYFTWDNNSDFRHWEAMRVGEDYVVWFSAKDADGNLRVSFVYSMDETVWDPGTVSNRFCILEQDPGETGETGETGDTGDTGETGDPGDTGDTGDTDEPGDTDSDPGDGGDGGNGGVEQGCACSASTSAAGALGLPLLLLGLALARRRR